jgi:signal transduction histidine kinase
LSAYAPIVNENESNFALVIDVDVSDFINITRATLYPFILFVVLIQLVLTSLTFYIVRLWKGNVALLQELDRQKDELLGIVAHQLLTPVTAMRWSAEEILEDGDTLTAEHKDLAQTIMSQARDLVELVSLILDVSRVQLGRLPLSQKDTSLQHLFDEILDVIHIKAQEKKVELMVHLPTALPTAYIDERYTRMAIENLLSNAVKYTPTGGNVELDVRLDKEWVYVQVTDTGVGIPQKDQAKIFGKMFRASNVTGKIEGNGFGLYIAQGSTLAQGGDIGFTSTEGKGTTFWMRLPLSQEAAKKGLEAQKKRKK